MVSSLLRLAGALSLFSLTLAASASDTTPAPVVPAVIDVVTFDIHADGQACKLAVIPTPNLLRVDDSSDGYSIIYNPATEHYTGLEHRNYTYWEFSWPEVKAAVEGSKRYETRIKELGIEGMNSDSPPPEASATNSASTSLPGTNPNAAGAPAASSSSDSSGYVWKPTADKKRIAGLDCIRWTGESLTGPPVEAWCYAGPLPQVQNALAQLRIINEPIALVPVRTLVPPFVFEASDPLLRGGVTPVLISWGDAGEKNRFELLSVKTRQGQANLFTVPKLYVKTTLVTMDGIGNQKVETGTPNLPSSPMQTVPTPSGFPTR